MISNKTILILAFGVWALLESMLVLGATDNVDGWRIGRVDPDNPENTICDGLTVETLPKSNKETSPFPPNGGYCVMRERFSDDDSPRNAQDRVRERFTNMVATYAGSVVGLYREFERKGKLLQTIRDVIIDATYKEIGAENHIEERNVYEDSEDKAALPWEILVHTKADIPRLPVKKAMEAIFAKIEQDADELARLRERVAILEGFSEADRKQLAELRAENDALMRQNKELTKDKAKRLERLARRESASANEQGFSELSSWYDFQRRRKNKQLSLLEKEQGMYRFCESGVNVVQDECLLLRVQEAAEKKEINRFVMWAKELDEKEKLKPWNRHLLGVAYWRYNAGTIEQAKKEMIRALKDARKKFVFDEDKLRKMHYNLALFHAARGKTKEGLDVLKKLGEKRLDKEGFVLRAVLKSRVAQRKVCKDLRAACGEEQVASDACAGWRMALERGDCRESAPNDPNTTPGIGLAPDGSLLPLSVTLPDPFGPFD
uniref:Uncharacterized protein n=1 Tax=Candidatus Kentrum sp. FM TaxID=2126340 RepID=A0A450RYM6_9GAMM|nr:MAG: hypothetical protein BECKFM1743A_GA0114220_100149 [Candidatus Kentron sp. FM]VFJ44528.1 MAG: hypothetical protein BECKFM1743C_GA0114222_1001211 [Candidatus Kentron sp. FM]VFK05989.1 MAG: hypothetical protein BECKFM1743B_GA0114221_1000815 [Candidatus Kentron sp. FM]